MKKKQHLILTTLVMLILLVLVNCNEVKAAGATLSVSKQTVSPGETFELYIDLSVDSNAYEIFIDETGAEVSKELTSVIRRRECR